MSANADLNSLLQNVRADVNNALKITPEVEKQFSKLFGAQEEGAMAGVAGGPQLGTLGHQSIVLNVPITNGNGSYTSDKGTSWWVTMKGTLTIKAPAGQGTWDITVIDTVANTPVYIGSNLKSGVPYPFTYKTGFQVQFRASARWSQGGNTTLVVDLSVDY
jgi:hypothetical protein